MTLIGFDFSTSCHEMEGGKGSLGGNICVYGIWGGILSVVYYITLPWNMVIWLELCFFAVSSPQPHYPSWELPFLGIWPFRIEIFVQNCAFHFCRLLWVRFVGWLSFSGLVVFKNEFSELYLSFMQLLISLTSNQTSLPWKELSNCLSHCGTRLLFGMSIWLAWCGHNLTLSGYRSFLMCGIKLRRIQIQHLLVT